MSKARRYGSTKVDKGRQPKQNATAAKGNGLRNTIACIATALCMVDKCVGAVVGAMVGNMVDENVPGARIIVSTTVDNGRQHNQKTLAIAIVSVVEC